jgi:Cu/Ag efflux protein CusF
VKRSVKASIILAALVLFALLLWSALPGLHEAQTSGSGRGIVQWIDIDGGTVTLQHGPVPALNMEPMTMSFAVRDSRQLIHLRPMQEVAFEVSYHPRTGYTITHIR